MKALATLLILLMASPGFAASCDALSDTNDKLACYERSRDCAAMEDNQARLSCFDALFADTTAPTQEQSAPAAPSTSPVAVQPVETPRTISEEAPASAEVTSSPDKAQQDDLKFPLKENPTDEKMEIQAVVTEITDGGFRMDYVTLDNAQIWKEVTAHTIRLKVGQTVTIREGALGSKHLSVVGSNRKIRVKRVK